MTRASQWIWLIWGYNVNTQTSFPFLYTNNKISEEEIKETIPFLIATKAIKYLGVNLPKEILWKLLMLSNYGAGGDSWESLGLQGDQTSQS